MTFIHFYILAFLTNFVDLNNVDLVLSRADADPAIHSDCKCLHILVYSLSFILASFVQFTINENGTGLNLRKEEIRNVFSEKLKLFSYWLSTI